VDLSIDFAGLSLRNPVLLASGTCNYGRELQALTDLSALGGIVTKTITPQPRGGNRPQRIVETSAGMLNSIGLQNPGLDDFIADKWPFLRELDTPIVVNIAGHTIEEFGEMAARLEEVDGIAALEINISCPNVKAGGENFASNPAASAAVIKGVRSATRRPVIAKLSPNVTDIADIARAAEAIDIDKRRPLLGNITGGLSGPAIKPVALAMVWKVSQAVQVPVMGLGGISSARDALEFIVAGASAVQVGTASFVNPNAGVEIVEEIRNYCVERGIEHIGDLVGTLQV
jgi:dihydroorotate dehydrogenase (NAD+) catalytic subunit